MKDPEHHTTPRNRMTRYKLPRATGVRTVWWQKSDGSQRCNLKGHLDKTDLGKWDEMRKKGPYKRKCSDGVKSSTWGCDEGGNTERQHCNGFKLLTGGRGCKVWRLQTSF